MACLALALHVGWATSSWFNQLPKPVVPAGDQRKVTHPDSNWPMRLLPELPANAWRWAKVSRLQIPGPAHFRAPSRVDFESLSQFWFKETQTRTGLGPSSGSKAEPRDGFGVSHVHRFHQKPQFAVCRNLHLGVVRVGPECLFVAGHLRIAGRP